MSPPTFVPYALHYHKFENWPADESPAVLELPPICRAHYFFGAALITDDPAVVDAPTMRVDIECWSPLPESGFQVREAVCSYPLMSRPNAHLRRTATYWIDRMEHNRGLDLSLVSGSVKLTISNQHKFGPGDSVYTLHGVREEEIEAHENLRKRVDHVNGCLLLDDKPPAEHVEAVGAFLRRMKNVCRDEADHFGPAFGFEVFPRNPWQ